MLRGAHRQLRLRQQEPAVHDGEYAGDVQRGRGHDLPKQAKTDQELRTCFSVT